MNLAFAVNFEMAGDGQSFPYTKLSGGNPAATMNGRFSPDTGRLAINYLIID